MTKVKEQHSGAVLSQWLTTSHACLSRRREKPQVSFSLSSPSSDRYVAGKSNVKEKQADRNSTVWRKKATRVYGKQEVGDFQGRATIGSSVSALLYWPV